jgi:hypothetical protein
MYFGSTPKNMGIVSMGDTPHGDMGSLCPWGVLPMDMGRSMGSETLVK